MSDVPDEVDALVQRPTGEGGQGLRSRGCAPRPDRRDGLLRGRPARGPTVEPIAPAAPTRVRASDVASVLDEPATVDVSVHWVVEGWPEDVVRALDGLRANAGGRLIQYVVADVTETDPNVYGDDVEVLMLETGRGGARRGTRG